MLNVAQQLRIGFSDSVLSSFSTKYCRASNAEIVAFDLGGVAIHSLAIFCLLRRGSGGNLDILVPVNSYWLEWVPASILIWSFRLEIPGVELYLHCHTGVGLEIVNVKEPWIGELTRCSRFHVIREWESAIVEKGDNFGFRFPFWHNSYHRIDEYLISRHG